MEFGETIRGLSPIAGAGGPGLNNAKPRSNERKPQPSSPSEAQTPKEALTHINLLYKTGRMEDLAALLRRSKVFREAWLILQQSFPTHSETTEEVKADSYRTETAGVGNSPIRSLEVTWPRQKLPPEQGLAKLEVATEPESISAAVTHPGSVNCLNPAFKLTYSMTIALKVYKTQLGYHDHEKNSMVRISIRV